MRSKGLLLTLSAFLADFIFCLFPLSLMPREATLLLGLRELGLGVLGLGVLGLGVRGLGVLGLGVRVLVL